MQAIQKDLMAHGPVQASMYLTAPFEVYKSGVFTTQSKAYIGMHAVKITGWGIDNASNKKCNKLQRTHWILPLPN